MTQDAGSRHDPSTDSETSVPDEAEADDGSKEYWDSRRREEDPNAEYD